MEAASVAGLDIDRQSRQSFPQWPRCQESSPVERLRGRVLAVAAGQGTAAQVRERDALASEFLVFWIAAQPGLRERRYASILGWLYTGSARQAAKLHGLRERTLRHWVTEFLHDAIEWKDRLAAAWKAFDENDRISAAREELRRKLKDFLDAYCAYHRGGGDGRTVEVDSSQFRATGCAACAIRRGVFGDTGWGDARQTT
jgi:hypothetical protein